MSLQVNKVCKQFRWRSFAMTTPSRELDCKVLVLYDDGEIKVISPSNFPNVIPKNWVEWSFIPKSNRILKPKEEN